jgi:hypothetical protein
MTRTSRLVLALRRTQPKTLRLTLGLLVWLLAVLLPRIYRGLLLTPSAIALTLAAPVVLTIGTILARRNRSASEGVLIAGFPVAVALGMSGIDHDIALATFSPWLMTLVIACLAGYGAIALDISAQRARHREVEQKPLGEVAPVEPERRKQRLGTFVLASIATSAIAILIWGSWETPAHYREHWGKAAPSGALLAALIAGLTGVAALAVVAPGLRAERTEALNEAARGKRVSWLIFVAASGCAVYWLFYMR